jgi:hypothetical protein
MVIFIFVFSRIYEGEPTLDYRGSIPVRGNYGIFLFATAPRKSLGPTKPPVVNGGSFPRDKAAGA